MAKNTVTPLPVAESEPRGELEVLHAEFHCGISLLRVLERLSESVGSVEFQESLTLAVMHLDRVYDRMEHALNRLDQKQRA